MNMSKKRNGSSHQDSPKTFSEAFLRLIWGKRWAPYIIVLVVIASAIVTVWSVLKPSLSTNVQNQSSSSVTQTDSMHRESGNENANSDYAPEPEMQEVVEVTLSIRNPEKLAATWFSALKAGKADTLVAVSSRPFYAPSGEVYLTEDDLRTFYDSLTNSIKEDGGEIKNYAFEVKLLIDFAKQEGVRETTRRLLKKMSLRSDDILVFLWVGTEGSGRSGVGLFSRWFDGELRVMGVDFY